MYKKISDLYNKQTKKEINEVKIKANNIERTALNVMESWVRWLVRYISDADTTLSAVRVA